MTPFGTALKKCVDDNSVKVYQLAQKAGIERTNIQKYMSRGSIPSEERLEQLIAAMLVSPFEKDELRAAYHISKDGEFLYNQRIQIKRLIERMHDVQNFAEKKPITPRVHDTGSREDADIVGVVRGDLAVNGLIDDMLDCETRANNPHIRFVMPYDHAFFYDTLFQKSRGSTLKAECLFEFSKLADITKARRNANLDVIDALLPFILCAPGSFKAHYVYSVHPARHAAILPMPYFLVTSGRAATFTADMQTAIAFNREDVAECYGRIFDGMKTKSNALTKRVTSMEEIAAYYVETTQTKTSAMSGFGSHPCIALYYDRETLDAHLPPELPDRERVIEMLELVPRYMRNLPQKGGIPAYFTPQGLELFVKEGVIPTIDNRLFRNYTPPERVETFRKMMADIENGSMLYRVINTSKIRVPDCFYVDVFSGSRMNIVIGSAGPAKGLNTVNILEESVVDAFHDFLTGAAATEITYSKDDTLQTLRAALEGL